jgi:hypothetical protein
MHSYQNLNDHQFAILNVGLVIPGGTIAFACALEVLQVCECE